MADSNDAANSCELCGPPIVIDDDQSIHIRHIEAADAEDLEALYARLGDDDIYRRFFTRLQPPASVSERWSDIEHQGGFGLVAELYGPDGVTLVGEAGYARLADGDGELGITVDPDHRGWIGPWLLDELLVHAHERGVPNMQAVIRADNRAMMALARKRGFAILGHPEWGVIQLTMSTKGHTPSWPPVRRRPRVLVETERTQWRGDSAMHSAGFDVAICPVGQGPLHGCPAIHGEQCPLICGADVVLIDLEPGDPRASALLEAERLTHPDAKVLMASVRDTEDGQRRMGPHELVEAVVSLLGLDDPGEESCG